MITVIQRVTEAGVCIDKEVHSKIGKGLLILLGIKKGDTEANIKYLVKKIIDLRIFQDDKSKMNLNVREVDGEVMIISQFTLCTDNNKSGNRPSFTQAESAEKANDLYEIFIKESKLYYYPDKIKSGIFAAHMTINSVNDGPVTIILEN